MHIERNQCFLEAMSGCEKPQQNQQKSSRKPKRRLGEKDQRQHLGQQVGCEAVSPQTIFSEFCCAEANLACRKVSVNKQDHIKGAPDAIIKAMCETSHWLLL